MPRKTSTHLQQRSLDSWFFAAPARPEDVARTRRPRLELDDLQFPANDRPAAGAGGCRYEVRVVPLSTVKKVEELIQMVNGDAQTMHRLWTHFGEFQQINAGYAKEVALFLFVVDIHLQGLKASTCCTYISLLLEAASRAAQPMKGPLVNDLGKAFRLIACDDDVEHAVDIAEDDAWALLDRIPSTQQDLRRTLYMLLVFGFRAADGKHIKCHDVQLGSNSGITIYFRVTKNHRSAKERYSITITPRKLIPELTSIFTGVGPIPIYDCAIFNRSIKVYADITTYSLRRCFIQNVVRAHTRTGNFVCEVAKLTGHLELANLRSYVGRFQASL